MGGSASSPAEPAAMEEASRFGGVEATRMSTRTLDKDRVQDQRRRASQVVNSMPQKQRRASTMALGSLEALPQNKGRMSQIGKIDREKLVAKVEEASKHEPTGDLDGRLRDLGLAMHTMEGVRGPRPSRALRPFARRARGLRGSDGGSPLPALRFGGAEPLTQDGNCQFRSFAFNLFGTQEEHGVVREAAVAHMRANSDFFGMFFEEGELKRYLKGMSRACTWGDELTLRAVVEAYGCVAHVARRAASRPVPTARRAPRSGPRPPRRRSRANRQIGTLSTPPSRANRTDRSRRFQGESRSRLEPARRSSSPTSRRSTTMPS